MRGGIEEARDTHRRVGKKTQRFVSGSRPLRLQKIVQEVLRIGEIGAELANPRSQELRHDEAIGTCHGTDDADHQDVIENSDRSVVRLDRVSERIERRQLFLVEVLRPWSGVARPVISLGLDRAAEQQGTSRQGPESGKKHARLGHRLDTPEKKFIVGW